MSSDEETEEEEMCAVQVVDSDIFFYGDITRENVLKLVTMVHKLEKKLLKISVILNGYTPNITVYIHSDGGDFHSGMNAMDALRRSKVHVTTIAEGTCCSAATFILLGGDRRLMGRHAQLLIHQMSSGFQGKFEELRDEINTCSKLMKMMKKMYKKETKIPKEVLKQFLKRDIYLDSGECVRYGIVDGIV